MTQKLGLALRLSALAVAASAILGQPVAGQSLADVARKEAERRKAAKSASTAKPKDGKEAQDKDKKVFTNKDLPQGDAAPVPVPSEPPKAAASGGGESHQHPETKAPAAQGKPEPSADPKAGAGDEKYWRTRIETARGDLQRQQLFLDALQSRVNALTTDFVNRDDPAQRTVIAADRQKALDEMEAVRKEIDRLKKQVADIEEEARKAGVPAGWLR